MQMAGVKRTRAATRALPSLLCFPDDILLELVTQLDFACLYKTLLALCAVCRRTRALYSGTATLNALCAKHCTLWGLRTVPIGLDAMSSASLPLRCLHLGAQRWAFGFKRLFGIAPDEYDLFGRADTLQHIVQKAARTKRADFLGLFWDVFGYMRDLAVLRCDGLSAKELILLRMVAAAPCAMDMNEKSQKGAGKKILGSLLDLADTFLREFYQTTVAPHVASIEDYETAASAYQWVVRSIYTVLLNESTRERVRLAIHAADAQLFDLAGTDSKFMQAVFLYPTNLPLFNLCAKRFASFPRPREWDQPEVGHSDRVKSGNHIMLRPLPFRFMEVEATMDSTPATVVAGAA